MSRRIILGIAALLLAAGLVGVVATTSAHAGGVLEDLARTQRERVFAARFSIPTQHRECRPLPLGRGETVVRSVCGTEADAPRLVDRLAAAAESLDPDSLQASALAEIIFWDQTATAMDAAIERLLKALRLHPRSVPLLVDLSAAYMVRAERTQSPHDLIAGLDYALQALEREPRNRAARFNTALALESLALDQQALEAWAAYLRVEDDSRWSGEARRRLRETRRRLRAALEPAPEPGAAEADVAAFARRHPQRARIVGWDTVLGRWGAAVLEGERDRAGSLLLLAEQLGRGLVLRRGDATLADAVRSIRAAAGDTIATRKLARGHRAYAASQGTFGVDVSAQDSLAMVIELRPASPVLLAWARANVARQLVYAHRYDEASTTLDSLVAEPDSLRHGALAARVRWMLGTAHMKRERYREAQRLYRRSSTMFERVGETEFFGATRSMEGEAAYELGDSLESYTYVHQGLRALRATPTSGWRHSLLLVLALNASRDAMPLAAARIQDEGVWVARQQEDPRFAAEAWMAQAGIDAASGDLPRALRFLDSAAAKLHALRASTGPDTAAAELLRRLAYYRALVRPRGRAMSLAALDSTIEFVAEKNRAWIIPLLLSRVDVHLAAGRLNDAMADLARATDGIRALSEEDVAVEQQSAMLDKVRGRFDQLVMLHLRSGDTARALQVLEGGRASFSRERDVPVKGPPVAPPGHVAVEYALIGNSLLTWTVRGSTVQLVRQDIDRDSLLLAIEWAGTLLETPARSARATPHLQRLYDWLIRPISTRLGPAETPLMIVADGEIAGVPFAALWDARRRRYLIDDHSLCFAGSLTATACRADGPFSGSALLIADPAFDAGANPTLDGLRGARVEAEMLRRIYPDATMLRDTAASRAAFQTHAQRATVIHYAGHAVFDGTRPERSFLVLAGKGVESRLTAAAVDSLDLARTRLVVLSACRTLQGRHGRSGGFAGLSGALLSSGAGGVVGSLWEVNDRYTQPLMQAFHEAYSRSGDAPAALRRAQLLLRSHRNFALSSPATWAGFRYAVR